MGVTMKKVCFSCHTAYQLFVAHFIGIIYYSKYTKILIVNDNSKAIRNILENINKTGIWNEVIIIKEYGVTDDDVYKQLIDINLNDIDIMHYFAPWGVRMGRILLNIMDPKTKLILTEEGIAGYYPIKSYDINYKIYGQQYDDSTVNMNFNFNVFDELWVFDKKLYDNSISNIKVKTIDVIESFKLKNKQLLNKLNILFEYKNNIINENIIYVDQYLSDAKIMDADYEKYIIKNIIDICGVENIIVKQHPSLFSSEKYNKYKKIKFYNSENIPWEVILLNELYNNESFLKNKILIAYNSTMLLNTLILQKKSKNKCNIIFLYKIFKDLVDDNENSIHNDIHNKIMKSGYENIYVPNSFCELKFIVNKLLNKTPLQEITDRDLYIENKEELTVLKKIYIKNRNQSELILKNEQYKRKCYEEYYILLNKWLEMNQNNKSVAEYCKEHNYNKIVIYGMGNLGERLYDELKKTSCKVIGFIDSNSYKTITEKLQNLSIDKVKELQKEIDIIIVTPINYYKEIYNNLKKSGIESKIECLIDILENNQ